MYRQLVYASDAAQEFTEEELIELLAECRKNNEELGVSGVLLFVGKSFLQVLEGAADDVEKIYKIVANDKRHASIILLLRRDVENRGFGDWSMGYVNADRKKRELEGLFDLLKNRTFGELKADQKAIRNVLEGFIGGRWRKSIS